MSSNFLLNFPDCESGRSASFCTRSPLQPALLTQNASTQHCLALKVPCSFSLANISATSSSAKATGTDE
eukprot:13947283-Alexandrium_andersonii.AAC.1